MIICNDDKCINLSQVLYMLKRSDDEITFVMENNTIDFTYLDSKDRDKAWERLIFSIAEGDAMIQL